MSLKATVDTLADVPEALHSFYQEKDGKFNLTVEGLVPKARLDEFRDNNVTYKKQIDDLSARFKDVDPDKYKEMTDKEAKVRDKKLLEAGQVDTMIAERLAAMASARGRYAV